MAASPYETTTSTTSCRQSKLLLGVLGDLGSNPHSVQEAFWVTLASSLDAKLLQF